MKLRGALIPVVVLIAVVAVAVLIAVFRSPSDRFGSADEIARIKSSTSCAELRQTVDDASATMAADKSGAAFDRAVGHSNAANDRMKELGC